MQSIKNNYVDEAILNSGLYFLALTSFKTVDIEYISIGEH